MCCRFVQNPAFWGPKSRHGRPPVPKPGDAAAPVEGDAEGGDASPRAEGGTAPAAPGSGSERAPPQKLSKGMIKRLERREEMRRQHGGAGAGAAAAAGDASEAGAEGGGGGDPGPVLGEGGVAQAEGTAEVLLGKRPSEEGGEEIGCITRKAARVD